MSGLVATSKSVRRYVFYFTLFGLFLTVRGYRSREVDQAYRLPILLHQQDARLYADDPFVKSFERFNPHRGYLALLNGVSQPIGLSAALGVVFALTFLATVYGLERLGSAAWGDEKSGRVAASLILVALAGNVGTNHLMEPMLLDRLIAFGLGYIAIAFAVGNGRRNGEWSALAVGLAALVHPSVGLQLAMLLGVSWVGWRLFERAGDLKTRTVVRAIVLLGLAIVPGLAFNLRDSRLLLEGLSPEDLRRLSAELQSPQHMLPHLWRLPQWLAWFGYPILAACSMVKREGAETPSSRKRLLILLCVNLAGLALAWFGIEWLRHLRLTLFQPFRMATVARGVCLVFIAGHVARLWRGEGENGRLRAVLIAVGLLGDWMMVVVSAFEVTMTAREVLFARGGRFWGACQWAGWAVLASGMIFLSRHDTESGHVPILIAVVGAICLSRFVALRFRTATPRRLAIRLVACWAVPLAAIAANMVPDESNKTIVMVRQVLVHRWRFAEVPFDDVERLGVWCRSHTPEDARFIGPPGLKTFRLWSHRSLAFNRAGSPYHAGGLADWSRRFRDHVGFEGTDEAFVSAYLRDRHGLESRYDALSDEQKAELATRQGAGYVLTRTPDGTPTERGDSLALLRAEGRYAIYRVERPVQVAKTFNGSGRGRPPGPGNPR